MELPPLSITEPCGLSYSELARLPDDEVMLHVQGGHDDALAVLFDRYHRLILSVGYKILRDIGEAEDITQCVFLEIFQVAGQFDPARGSTKTWLLQYAYHRSLNRRRDLGRRDFYDKRDLEQGIRAGESESQSLFSSVEARKMLSGAVEDLTAAQRRTIHLVYFEGLSMREIAEKTGESVSNVRHHYYRGLIRLRQRMAGEKKKGEKESEGNEAVRRGIIDAEA